MTKREFIKKIKHLPNDTQLVIMVAPDVFVSVCELNSQEITITDEDFIEQTLFLVQPCTCNEVEQDVEVDEINLN